MHSSTDHAQPGLRHPRLYDLLLKTITRGREGEYREQLLGLAALRPGERVLDVGCGTGTLARAAWRRTQPGGSVVGVDVSPPMIVRARALASRTTRDASLAFVEASAAALPFAAGAFDVVMITTVLHMIAPAERASALAEASRVLRSGGRLLVVDYGGAHRAGLVARLHAHRSFELSSVVDLLPAAGLRKAKQGSLGWLSLAFLLAEKAAASGAAVGGNRHREERSDEAIR